MFDNTMNAKENSISSVETKVLSTENHSSPIDENDIEFKYDEINVKSENEDGEFNGEGVFITNEDTDNARVESGIQISLVDENDIDFNISISRNIQQDNPKCIENDDKKEEYSVEKVEDDDQNSFLVQGPQTTSTNDDDDQNSFLVQGPQTTSTNDDDDEFDFDENAFKYAVTATNNVSHRNESPKVVVEHSVIVANCNLTKEVETSELIYSPTEKVENTGNVLESNDCDTVDWAKERAAAAEEWGNVQEIEITAESTIESQNTVVSTSPVSFLEAIEYFQACDLSEYSNKIVSSIQRSGIASIFNLIAGPPPLKKFLSIERDFIFALALIKFDNDKNLYLRILFTIYKTLTKINVDCPRFGPHWENIGFQGNDPSTDLRGCGMLGLITILHFIKTESTSTLAAKIYHLSQDEVQNFPFCVLSINVTRIALQVLREGKLNKECNKRYRLASKPTDKTYTGIVYEVFQELYVAIFNYIYMKWKNEYKTMVDSGFVMAEIESYAKTKTMELIMGLQKTPKKKSKTNNDKIDNLQGLDEI